MSTTYRLGRRRLLTALAASALTLTACGTDATDPASAPTAATVLEEHQLAGLDARETIEQLDSTPVAERSETLLASVQPEELILTDSTTGSGSGETTIPMPDDQFYLSIAPYKQRTHDCFFHSLTTCLGELSEEEVQVTVTDDATGQTIIDESRPTYDNGFVGLWLPRDITGVLTIEHDGATATAPIATGEDDLTCLTSMQLA